MNCHQYQKWPAAVLSNEPPFVQMDKIFTAWTGPKQMVIITYMFGIGIQTSRSTLDTCNNIFAMSDK